MSLRARPALLGSIPITKNAVLFQMSTAMLGDTHVTPGTSGIDTRMLASQVLADMTMGDADMETGVNTTGIEVLDDAGRIAFSILARNFGC